jgi:hypothetical protein
MRFHLFRSVLALLACGGLHAQDQSAAKWAKARDVVSETDLREQAKTAKTMQDQLASMAKPVGDVRPSSGNSLYTKSIILFDGEMHTVVPVGSVLHLPAPLRSKVISAPTGDFTFWPNFLKRNSAWLAAKEVPLEMAMGNSKLGRTVLNTVGKDARLLVSVYKSCPISILEAPKSTEPPKP